jgi:hypothetical protein
MNLSSYGENPQGAEIMDRVLLEQELAVAQERITQIEMRIDRKIALIDDLKSRGVATLVEANLLREFRRARALWVSEWNRLGQQLSTRSLIAPPERTVRPARKTVRA